MNTYKLVVSNEHYAEAGRYNVEIAADTMAEAKKCANSNGYVVHAIICTEGKDAKAEKHEAARTAGFKSVKVYDKYQKSMASR